MSAGGDPSLARIANTLSLTERTLQRRLREQNASHQLLLDEMRRDAVLRYLKETELAVCEIACLVGLSESSALHRAFKRWTGMTPGEYRATQICVSAHSP